ncbi:MAG: L-seryl-tRNA(Sec) selenium transferase [candidate division Zixibacteria bacterium]
MAGKGNKKLRLSDFPSISSVLEDDRLKPLVTKWSFPFVSSEVKRIASELKKSVRKGKDVPGLEDFINETERIFTIIETDMLHMVINGTGVILHTNLGRSPIDPDVFDSLKDAVCGYSNLEFDLGENKRSKRGTMVAYLIASIAGADSGLMVNNNASSVYLIVANLATGKDVIISRGQLVQIGGGFRIPEIIERTGAKLKEVGTTNKTSLTDYRKAINKNTGLILIVHKSNFVQKGFTEEPEVSKIVELAKQKKVPVCYDLGSGLLPMENKLTPSDEPDIKSAVRTGADLVCFSGDKLLGGPQAGLIVGKKRYISALLKDPLYRVVRPDKLTIGLMEGTLQKYTEGKSYNLLWNMASLSVGDLKKRAKKIVAAIGDSGLSTTCLKSSFGGGSLPEYEFESFGLKIKGKAAALSNKLRSNSVPIIARTTPSGVLIDLRTVLPGQDGILIDALKSCL